MLNPCYYVKESAARIMKRASHVKINEDKLVKSLEEYQKQKVNIVSWTDSHLYDEETIKHLTLENLLRYIFVVDTLNFCFWPNEGFEYIDLAKNLTNLHLNEPAFFSPQRLSHVKAAELKEKVFSNLDFCLLEERARLLNELGLVILDKFESLFTNLVSRCERNASKLVEIIVSLIPGFRDESIYNGEQVFFYKRAQILTGDIWGVCMELKEYSEVNVEGIEICDFGDSINDITMFADYRVPQILFEYGVMEYSEELSKKIENHVVLEHGSKEEIEIRAATIIAVELIKETLKSAGEKVNSVYVDWYLWQQGEKLKDKIKPHHRVLSIFY